MSDDDILHLTSNWATTLNFKDDKYCSFSKNDLLTFTRAIIAAERQACYALCHRFAARNMSASECAAAILARGE